MWIAKIVGVGIRSLHLLEDTLHGESVRYIGPPFSHGLTFSTPRCRFAYKMLLVDVFDLTDG